MTNRLNSLKKLNISCYSNNDEEKQGQTIHTTDTKTISKDTKIQIDL